MYTRSEIYTTSNFLSFFRLLMAVPFWILTGMLYEPSIRPIVAGMALFAAFTDVLDGYFARRYNQVTEIGKIIDPLADKIALGAVVIRLFMINEIPDYFFYMIIGRDALIFLGGILVSKKIGRVLPSNMLGKITVIVLGLVIIMILLGIDKSSPIFQFPFYISIVLIFISLFGYIYRAIEYIKKEGNGNSK
jgi:CDP-diacylglycerol--glycerol-3-phosphate 3-phosphatidyltransferase